MQEYVQREKRNFQPITQLNFRKSTITSFRRNMKRAWKALFVTITDSLAFEKEVLNVDAWWGLFQALIVTKCIREVKR